MTGTLLVTGTCSDSGKSTVVAGLCRYLARRGVRVAPFKAQNMSNNSAVTADGGEIGRAQAKQAAAAGLEPDVAFNPVLLKPGSDYTSQIVVRGKPWGTIDAANWPRLRRELSGVVAESLTELRSRYDVVICEGAGSPAEINLRAHDIVNLGLARTADIPTIVVGDIDRGGVFASLYGTLALLEPADQRLIAGFVVNKFRGDVGLLRPGLDSLTELTGRPVYGVLPWLVDLWLDAEDSLALDAGGVLGRPRPPRGEQWLRVAVVRLPRISNATDVEALAAEPGVRVRITSGAADLAEADLIVIPGSKSTVDDLEWLRDNGLDTAIRAHAEAGKPLLGICGGYQMLGRVIRDDVESKRGSVPGLGLLPAEFDFAADKTLTHPKGHYGDIPVSGYEIHYGRDTVDAGAASMFRLADGTGEGARLGSVSGTHWHGAFGCDAFRRAFLTGAAALAGRDRFAVDDTVDFAALRESELDALADLVGDHLDMAAITSLIRDGAAPDAPSLLPRLV
ncbi:cobyric acid synthase [Stackebrandtia nassauensis]|uniref:cobyric acid synthase n=1 Tax=Stackebrandtia nassauensis TaxID=283811 RepID=UPI0005A2B0B0